MLTLRTIDTIDGELKQLLPNGTMDETNRLPSVYAASIMDEAGKTHGVCGWMNNGADAFLTMPGSRPEEHVFAASLLADAAFACAEVTQLCMVIAVDDDAVDGLSSAGFAAVGLQSGKLMMRLTRERHRSLRQQKWLQQVTDAMCSYDAGSPLRIHHFLKMHAFARQIGLHEGLDENTQFVLEVAAMTHDIGIKLCIEQTGACPGHLQEKLGPPEAEKMLTTLGLPRPVIERVCFLIAHHHTTQKVSGIDWQIILEADYLVNMIENNHSQEQIDTFAGNVFRTAEGKRLLSLVRPADE